MNHNVCNLYSLLCILLCKIIKNRDISCLTHLFTKRVLQLLKFCSYIRFSGFLDILNSNIVRANTICKTVGNYAYSTLIVDYIKILQRRFVNTVLNLSKKCWKYCTEGRSYSLF